MTQQITYNAFENQTLSLVKQLLEKPLNAVSKEGYSFPESFMSDLDAYLERNYIVKAHPPALKKTHCIQCFKSHALFLAKKHNLEAQAIKIINKAISGKTGHDGYYLDGNNLVSF